MHSVVASELNSIAKLLADSSLKAYYRFNTGVLTTDEKATYTLTNNNSVAEGTGKFGIGADFGVSNTTKTFSLASCFGLTNSSDFTFSMWVKMNTEITSGSPVLMTMNFATNKYSALTYDYNSGTRRLTFDFGYSFAQYTIALGTSNWTHIAITKSGSAMKMYVNGILVATGTIGTSGGDGSNTFTCGGGLSAIIDDYSVWSRELDPDEIKILAGYTTPATEIAKTVWDKHANLKLHMKFDETTGTDVADSSGANHPGVASAASIIANNIGGMFNNKGVFVAASSNKVTITDHADLKPTGAFSIGGWIKTTQTNFASIFLSGSENTNGAGITLFINASAGKLNFQISKNTGVAPNTDRKNVDSLTSINDGNWHFVVASWDGTTQNLYIDGILEASQSAFNAVYAATNYVRVGCFCASGTDALFFNGSLDDLFLLNGTALSAEQVREIYEGRKLGELYPTTGIRALYHLSNEKDYSGNDYHLTNTNGVTFSLGKFKNAADYGTTQQNNKLLTIGGRLGISGTGNKTYLCWVKLKTEITSLTYMLLHHILNDNETNQGAVWQLYYNYNAGTRRVEVQCFNNSTNPLSVYEITLGTTLWHHIGYTDNAGTITLYVDGKAVGTPFTRPTLNQAFTSVFTIGNNNAGGAGTPGLIDEVFVASRALSETEIRKIYMKAIGKLL